MVAPLFPLGYGLSYGSNAPLGRVNEDPRIDLSAFDNAANFFLRGKAPAPWHFSNDGSITHRAIDLTAQEDGRQFSWNGPGSIAIQGNPVNLSVKAGQGAALQIEWRVDRLGAGPVRLSLGGATLDLTGPVRAAKAGKLIETRIALRCFIAGGANLTAVGEPLKLTAGRGFIVSLRSIRIVAGSAAGVCPAAIKVR